MKEEFSLEVLKHHGKEFFGRLYPYIADIDITDINCTGDAVWVNDVNKGRYKVENFIYTTKDIETLAYKVSNTENAQFNKTNPTLSADLYDLRFMFVHDSFAVSGTTVSIRKTPTTARIKDNTLKRGEVEYLSDKARDLLKACIIARQNTVICGLTGSGKTELVKYLVGVTKPSERIITIEDTSELHLKKIYPQKDIVELKVNSQIDYEGAIKTCMRLLPVWLLLSEARGKEVKDLLKCISTGAKIVTTIHTGDAKQIPSRMLNMFEDNELSNDKVENMIYDFIDIGIHINAFFEEGKTVRYVDQIVYFYVNEKGERVAQDIYKVYRNADGSYSYKYNRLPEGLQNTLESFGFGKIGLSWRGSALGKGV